MARSHLELVRGLELKAEFEILIKSVPVPKQHTTLNVKTAKWCLRNMDKKHGDNPSRDDVVSVCHEFLEVSKKSSV